MHPAIEKYLAGLEDLRKRALTMEQAAIDGTEAMKLKLPSSESDEFRKDGVRFAYYTLYVEMYVTSFTQVVPVLRDFRKRGYKMLSAHDNFDMNRRWWQFSGDVIIDASLPYGDKSACRRVQKGVKEVPVYKWECDDGSEAVEIMAEAEA